VTETKKSRDNQRRIIRAQAAVEWADRNGKKLDDPQIAEKFGVIFLADGGPVLRLPANWALGSPITRLEDTKDSVTAIFNLNFRGDRKIRLPNAPVQRIVYSSHGHITLGLPASEVAKIGGISVDQVGRDAMAWERTLAQISGKKPASSVTEARADAKRSCRNCEYLRIPAGGDGPTCELFPVHLQPMSHWVWLDGSKKRGWPRWSVRNESRSYKCPEEFKPKREKVPTDLMPRHLKYHDYGVPDYCPALQKKLEQATTRGRFNRWKFHKRDPDGEIHERVPGKREDAQPEPKETADLRLRNIDGVLVRIPVFESRSAPGAQRAEDWQRDPRWSYDGKSSFRMTVDLDPRLDLNANDSYEHDSRKGKREKAEPEPDEKRLDDSDKIHDRLEDQNIAGTAVWTVGGCLGAEEISEADPRAVYCDLVKLRWHHNPDEGWYAPEYQAALKTCWDETPDGESFADTVERTVQYCQAEKTPFWMTFPDQPTNYAWQKIGGRLNALRAHLAFLRAIDPTLPGHSRVHLIHSRIFVSTADFGRQIA
jgi:hypothetical protein